MISFHRQLCFSRLVLVFLSLSSILGVQCLETCLESCQRCVQAIHFSDFTPDVSELEDMCQSRLRLSSIYLCMSQNCDPSDVHAGFRDLAKTCRDLAGGISIPPLDIVSNYTSGDISRLRHVALDDQVLEEDSFEPVVPVREFFLQWFKTLDTYSYVDFYHHYYGWLMGIYWAVIVAMGIGTRMLTAASRVYTNQHPQRKDSTSKPAIWIQRQLLIPATFGYRHSQSLGSWGTIPQRSQTLAIVAFVALNIWCTVFGYKWFAESLYFPTIPKQALRYFSDRTGIISFANFPIIWLFGMRNNLVIWLTGWDFATYSNFHRWVARISTLQAVLHSVGYTVLILREGGWPYFVSWWSQLFWWAGEIATVAMCALVAASFYLVRRRQYELFLVSHIVLSIITLGTMLGHVSIFDGEYDGLFWAPAFIWVLDRLLRLCRIAAFNPKVWDTRGEASYDPASQIVRLTIPTDASLYEVKPGTHFYLMVMNQARFWESHPFTVASTCNASRTKSLDGDQEEPLLASAGEGDDTLDAESAKWEDRASSGMTFLIRPYDSFTKRLKETAEAAWPKPVSVPVLVDGPYGHTWPLHTFEHVVFIVGGSGIVVPLSYLGLLTSAGRRPKVVDIHWAVRERGFANDVIQKDCAGLLNASHVSMHTYLTSQSHATTLPKPAKCRMGRLDASQVVRDAVSQAGDGTLAVVACGPARMADDARAAVVYCLGEAKGRVEYFEEGFQW